MSAESVIVKEIAAEEAAIECTEMNLGERKIQLPSAIIGLYVKKTDREEVDKKTGNGTDANPKASTKISEETQNEKTIISVENVTKSYQGTPVLNNVSVTFERRKIHGIIGRNGSGKTVLIKTICGLVRPDQGHVTVNGRIIGKEVDFPENVGVIIEAPGFLPSLSACRNLEYLASLRNVAGKEEVRNAIALVGLNPDDKKHVGKYSLGMKQRLGLAQAIMENPDILILDEPMNGLDKSGMAEIRELLLRFREEGKTILIVSHNSEDIRMLCDTVHEMDGGRISRLP